MGRDLAIDLGTANTLVYRQGEGIVFNEPTVVAMNASSGKVEAMGDEAWQMIGGRSGNVVALRPLRHGVMTEFDITQRMIEVVLRRVGVSRFPRPRVLSCVASESSEVERRAVREAVKFAGGRDVVLVEEPLAAAVGARLPIHEPIGNLIVDIGGGTHRDGGRLHGRGRLRAARRGWAASTSIPRSRTTCVASTTSRSGRSRPRRSRSRSARRSPSRRDAPRS